MRTAAGKLFLVSLLAVFSTPALFATEIRLLPPHRVFTNQVNLCADFATSSTLLSDDVLRYLNYGIVLTFTYFVNFYENRMFDAQLSQIRVTKRVYYDLWTQLYTLETYDPVPRKTSYRKIEEVLTELESLTTVIIIPLTALSPDAKYYFKTRNTLKITQLYSFLHILFNFLSIFKYKTTYLTSPDYMGKDLVKGFSKPIRR